MLTGLPGKFVPNSFSHLFICSDIPYNFSILECILNVELNHSRVFLFAARISLQGVNDFLDVRRFSLIATALTSVYVVHFLVLYGALRGSPCTWKVGANLRLGQSHGRSGMWHFLWTTLRAPDSFTLCVQDRQLEEAPSLSESVFILVVLPRATKHFIFSMSVNWYQTCTKNY